MLADKKEEIAGHIININNLETVILFLLLYIFFIYINDNNINNKN